jgi:hypothetical protein
MYKRLSHRELHYPLDRRGDVLPHPLHGFFMTCVRRDLLHRHAC